MVYGFKIDLGVLVAFLKVGFGSIYGWFKVFLDGWFSLFIYAWDLFRVDVYNVFLLGWF